MDQRQFSMRLSELTGVTPREAASMTEALGAVMGSRCADLDSVAIPAFGTFTASKHDEHIEEDAETGQRTLFPPAVVAEFRPSVILRHRLDQ